MTKSTLEVVRELYDQRWFDGRRLHIDKLGFHNLGYWKGVDDSVELAQINLIETLVSFFTKRDGNVLDVACGNGASTKYLTKYFNSEDITGINISERQLQVCRAVAPECTFKLMDATKLDFSNSSFDNVLCIEAAFHFKTRHGFLEEAYRVLKAGGRLAMSDGVIHDPHTLDLLFSEDWKKEALPRENCLPNLDAYREDLLKVGFRHVRVDDITEFSAIACRDYCVRKMEREFGERHDSEIWEELMQEQNAFWHRATSFCMVHAIK